MTQDISDEAVERILDQLQGEGHAYIAKLVINHGSTGYIMLAASDTIRAIYARLKDIQIQNKSLSLAQETHLALIAELEADITTLSTRLKEADDKLTIACEALEAVYEITVEPAETDHKSVRGWIEVSARQALALIGQPAEKEQTDGND